ncbi:MAG: hypothetical protein WC873_03050 [Candidatus Gracilibacteria bacterium]
MNPNFKKYLVGFLVGVLVAVAVGWAIQGSSQGEGALKYKFTRMLTPMKVVPIR